MKALSFITTSCYECCQNLKIFSFYRVHFIVGSSYCPILIQISNLESRLLQDGYEIVDFLYPARLKAIKVVRIPNRHESHHRTFQLQEHVSTAEA